MISLKCKYQAWIFSTLFCSVFLGPTHTLSHEIKYIILWASTSPTGPISGVGRQFDKYTFSNLEDCEAQIAKELWDEEHDGNADDADYFGLGRQAKEYGRDPPLSAIDKAGRYSELVDEIEH